MNVMVHVEEACLFMYYFFYYISEILSKRGWLLVYEEWGDPLWGWNVGNFEECKLEGKQDSLNDVDAICAGDIYTKTQNIIKIYVGIALMHVAWLNL